MSYDDGIVADTFFIGQGSDWPLASTLYAPKSPTQETSGPAILMSAAAGVPQGYYAQFARHLVASGAAAVLTYDYRGMAGSSGDRKNWSKLAMKDWALRDFPAAARWLKESYPDCEMVGMGHSYGGQALGLSGVSELFSRYATVATMSGYWRDLDTPYSVWFQTQIVARTIVALLGYVPKGFGLGEAFPGPIMKDWARWISKPDYFFTDPHLPETKRFGDVTLPFLSIGLADDPWGTPKAIDSFMAHYENADFRQIWLSPGESGKIGHLSYFTRRHKDLHWPVARDFLLTGRWPK